MRAERGRSTRVATNVYERFQLFETVCTNMTLLSRGKKRKKKRIGCFRTSGNLVLIFLE